GIVVQEEDVVGAGLEGTENPAVIATGPAVISAEFEDFDAFVVAEGFADIGNAFVVGAVVHEDVADVGIGVLEEARIARVQVLQAVPVDDQNMDEGLIHDVREYSSLYAADGRGTLFR